MAMDIYRYDNLQELEVLAQNRVATWTFREKKQQPGAPATTKSLHAWQAQQGEGKGEEEKHERGEKRGELPSLPNPFFFSLPPYPLQTPTTQATEPSLFSTKFYGLYWSRGWQERERERATACLIKNKGDEFCWKNNIWKFYIGGEKNEIC